MENNTPTNFKYRNIVMRIIYTDPNQRKFVELKNTFHEIEMLGYIEKRNIKGTYIDVGGCCGNHSIFFSKFTKADEIITFEPNKNNFEKILKNIEINNCKNIIVFNYALAEKEKMVGIENKIDAGQNKIIENENENNIYAYPLDKFSYTDVKIIKIDVEGYEKNVLIGAKKTIEINKPLLFIESHVDPVWIFEFIPKGYKIIRRFNNSPTYLFEFFK